MYSKVKANQVCDVVILIKVNFNCDLENSILTYMPKKKKRKEILVDTTVLKRREDELLKDTTGLESYDVFKISAKFGRLLGHLVAAVGILFLILSLYTISIGAQFLLLGSEVLFFIFLSFLGAINILGGLLLLAKE